MTKLIYLHGKSGKRATIVDDERYLELYRLKPYYSNGYAYVWKDGKQVPVQNYVLGVVGMVDHINGNSLDNRFENLRKVEIQDNNKNKVRYANNTSGHTGVTNRNGKWQARININGKEVALGTYVDKQDAIDAYSAAADTYFKEYRRKEDE